MKEAWMEEAQRHPSELGACVSASVFVFIHLKIPLPK